MKYLLLTLALLWATIASATAGIDVDWQAQFVSAPSWTTFGISDLPGVDNTAALNALPGNTPMIGDCPNGGTVNSTGVSTPPNNLILWQRTGCFLTSDIVTPGIYPITAPADLSNLTPVTGWQWYNVQVRFNTRISTVRYFLVNCQHCIMRYGNVDNTGGFGFFAGCDFEIGRIYQTNTFQAPGNPGPRWLWNVPGCLPTNGKHSTVWINYFYSDSGDAAGQACQPTPIPGLWTSPASTNGMVFEHLYHTLNNTPTFTLVNTQLVTNTINYFCDHIRFQDANGGGRVFSVIAPGGPHSQTHDIVYDTGSYNGLGTTSGLYAIGAGFIKRGPFNLSGSELTLVKYYNISITQAVLGSLELSGPFTFILRNVSLGPTQSPRVAPNALISGTTNLLWDGGTVDGPTSLGADKTQLTSAPTLRNLSITNLPNNAIGLTIGNVSGGSATANTFAPVPGATSAQGIYTTSDPAGAHNFTATGNDLTGIPFPVNCAPNQGNTIRANTGAPDCP